LQAVNKKKLSFKGGLNGNVTKQKTKLNYSFKVDRESDKDKDFLFIGT
jgi:hypothetical protein